MVFTFVIADLPIRIVIILLHQKNSLDYSYISNDCSFRQKHPGVPDGSDCSDGTSYPLTENYTLPIALHSISKMYFRQWSERMWSVNLDASISGVSDRRRAFLLAFGVSGSAGDKPGCADNMPGSTWERRRRTWERRRHVCEHLESQSFIQFVFSSMYLCVYISI